jgi:hypothetical protein
MALCESPSQRSALLSVEYAQTARAIDQDYENKMDGNRNFQALLQPFLSNPEEKLCDAVRYELKECV